jgi:hypothetical protein
VTSLGEKVLMLHLCLEQRGIPHAMGGAIALAYAVEQARATNDVDINVFVSREYVDDVLAALPQGVRVRPTDADVLRRDGQARLRWDDNPIDLFLSTVPLHDAAATRTRSVPFERGTIPVLAPTDLAVCKSLYGRGKDWVDIESMRDAGTIDVPEALRWVEEMLGRDHPNFTRLHEILTAAPRSPADGDPFPPAMRPSP